VIIWSANDPPLPIEVDEDVYEWLPKRKWRANERGYVYAMVDYKIWAIHRLIMGVTDSNLFVDHKDNNPLNNKRENLRLATPSQSIRNRRCNRDNKCGFKGVSQCRWTGKWNARLYAHGKSLTLGKYATPEDAARAWDIKARELFGEFARLNLPDRANEPPPVDLTSKTRTKFAGVHYSDRPGRQKRWRAHFKFDRGPKSLGFYETEEEAANAVLDFVLTNCPERLKWNKFKAYEKLLRKRSANNGTDRPQDGNCITHTDKSSGLPPRTAGRRQKQHRAAGDRVVGSPAC
jgi:hypothetical protein